MDTSSQGAGPSVNATSLLLFSPSTPSHVWTLSLGVLSTLTVAKIRSATPWTLEPGCNKEPAPLFHCFNVSVVDGRLLSQTKEISFCGWKFWFHIFKRANLGAQLRRHVLPELTYNNLGWFSKCGFLIIYGFGVGNLVLARTVYTFTTSDFFSVLKCFSISVFVSPVVSILGFGTLIWHFVRAQKSLKCWVYPPDPNQGVLRRL